jgi:hypothetical protein
MNCLLNYIGLQGCSAELPLSGVYINDYPGMSSELLEKIATPEQASYIGMWNSAQAVSYLRIKRDIQLALFESAEAQLDQVLFQTSKNFVQQWQQIQVVPEEAILKGAFVSIQGSKYLSLRIKQLLVYNAGSETVTDCPWFVFQTQDGSILDQGTYNLVPGMNYIPINNEFYSDFDKINIMAAVDCTNLATTTGMFIDWGWNQMQLECATRFTYLWRNGWSIFPVTAPLGYGFGDSWTQDNSQSGVYMDAQLLCSLDSFICQQKEFLVDAWANILCYQILWAKVASPRANYFSQGNREFTERAMATFLEGYQQSLAIWARQLNLRGEGLCFNCDNSGLIQQGFVRP